MELKRVPGTARISGGVAIGVVGLLAALAVMFGNASGTQQTADEALAAQHVEITLGSLATLRTALGQTLLVAEASPGNPAIPVLIDDARLLTEELRVRLTATEDALEVAGLDLASDQAPLIAAAGATLAALEAGDTAATSGNASALAMELDALTAELVFHRDTLVASFTSAGQEAGRVATAARFMVALGIPGGALLSWAAVARKRRKREQMEAALEREREMNRSKDQLIANISHELRTPLTGIYAAARTLTDTDDAEIAGELTGVIVEQSTELTRMVEDLLVSAQADADRLSLALQEVDAAAAVARVVDEFARTGTSVEAEAPDGMVVADPLRLRQVLRNLVSNARDHGGDLIRIEGTTAEGNYRFTVSDNGDGVPPAIEERLFTPFVHRGDQPLITGSVGLGLSITRLLAEAMGGSIEYRRDGGITRFVVELPGPPRDPAPSSRNGLVAEETDTPNDAETAETAATG